VNLLVLAKEPRPGWVKTRLCPPCSPGEAAELAAASLADTLAAARLCGAGEVVLALDGQPGEWLPEGVTVVPQGTGGLDRRLACAWGQVRGPTLQIGMDTPQLTPAALDDAFDALARPGVDAAFGPALDGGWWAVGLREPDPRAFPGIAPSRPDTGRRQRDRLRQLGLRIADLATVRDVDDIGDARAVAAEAPATAFAHTLRRLGHATPHATAEPCAPTEDPPAEPRKARDARASVAPTPWGLREHREHRG
jgi:glycosyltransferase A (GT-A) superfamily protein (DUF2064 family)